jgi:hypothetical protein
MTNLGSRTRRGDALPFAHAAFGDTPSAYARLEQQVESTSHICWSGPAPPGRAD